MTTDHAMELWDDERTFALEDSIWWAEGRRYLTRNFLRFANDLRPLRSLLDIGCGSGGMLPVIAEFGKAYGVEKSETLANKSRKRGIAEAVYVGDFQDIEYASQPDAITLMDVLEHIEHDSTFISQIAQRFTNPHFLLVSVPACPWLYSQHDVLLQHYRRYTERQLRSVLEGNGYKVVRSNHFMCALFPVAALARLGDKMRRTPKKEIGLGQVPGPINTVLKTSLALEARIGKMVKFPFGLSVFALAIRT